MWQVFHGPPFSYTLHHSPNPVNQSWFLFKYNQVFLHKWTVSLFLSLSLSRGFQFWRPCSNLSIYLLLGNICLILFLPIYLSYFLPACLSIYPSPRQHRVYCIDPLEELSFLPLSTYPSTLQPQSTTPHTQIYIFVHTTHIQHEGSFSPRFARFSSTQWTRGKDYFKCNA